MTTQDQAQSKIALIIGQQAIRIAALEAENAMLKEAVAKEALAEKAKSKRK